MIRFSFIEFIRLFTLCSFVLLPWASYGFDSASKKHACKRETNYLAKQTLAAPSDKSFNASCFIDSLDHQGHRLIVDTRTQKSYSRLHALGSVNLPATQIVAKKQLAHQPLLIVGESHDRFMAGQLCGRLANAGFQDVKILLGGIRALVEELSTVDAREVLIELLQDQIYLVAASEAVVASIPELSGQFVEILDIADKDKTFERILSLSANANYPLVIIGSKVDYQALRRLMNIVFLPNLYLVDGGPWAVKKYIAAHEQIQVAIRSVPNRYKCS